MIKYIVAAVLGTSLSGFAQMKWVSPATDSGWVVEGRLWQEGGYGRLPARAQKMVRPQVWRLGTQSAGLKIRFWSNSPDIFLEYQLAGKLALPHMPATGVSGFDLYRRTPEGKQFWLAATKPTAMTGKVKLVSGLKGNPRVPSLYTLYLPLYNGVKSLKIGVPEGKLLEPAAANKLKPIVVYGTSIAQGACATRPGLAWTNILERRLDWPVVNLGFSGNGRMETEVTELFVEKEAAVYVIDCLPNVHTQQVRERIAPLLDLIRRHRPDTPILLVESALLDDAVWNHRGRRVVEEKWAALRAEYNKRKSKDKNLYYLSGKNLLGNDGEATVDAVHPNDIGMVRYADAYEKVLRPILGLETREVTSAVSATPQLREIPGYNFMLRHQQILERNKKVKPDVVWLGDSIIHFFGGEPKAPYIRGAGAWQKLFVGKKVTNLGYGWDRTENVLWRIQRGELNGIRPKTILLSIGTNDLSVRRKPAQIRESILNLTREIRKRQPQAQLIVTGIMPRSKFDALRRETNALIRKASGKHGFTYLDLDAAFPVQNAQGKSMIRGLAPDQLHPVAEGYRHLAELIAKHL